MTDMLDRKRTPWQQGQVESSGLTLRYTVEGSGTPLFVVGSSTYYPRTFSRSLKQKCTLICADLPHFVKHGPDYNLSALSFDTYASHIEAVRTELEFPKIIIVGHSHHGNVALEYAKRFPEKVSRVVMIGSPPVDIAGTIEGSERYWRDFASSERKALLQEKRASIDPDNLNSLSPEAAYITQYIADAPLYWYDPHYYDASPLWQDMHFNMNTIYAFRRLFENYELTCDAEYLKAPVLVVMGRHDYAVPHILWEKVLPTQPNITFRLLDRSGHTPQFEQPEAFDTLLLDWLRHPPLLPKRQAPRRSGNSQAPGQPEIHPSHYPG